MVMLEMVLFLLNVFKCVYLNLIVFVWEIDSVEVILVLEVGEFDFVFVCLDGEVGSGIVMMLLVEDCLVVVLLREYVLVVLLRVWL